ncbi:MAG: hypothetical protein ACR2GA_02150 [Chloroflexota bacterium]
MVAPRPIHTEADADAVQAMMNALMDRAATLSDAEHDVLLLDVSPAAFYPAAEAKR